ncbi:MULTISPECIES: AzlC family ABC transporter permease [Bacillus]|uniref:4-azaleucine resistance transporter AzlC n=1 Tax=Bacillus capparidis TaxID=1840411 RepID=A0ABS4CPN3_9BACI|nr:MULTISPECIES: AzlC family ABC transporter permease [Bacillus]MBP1079533.1 4-azaleucine resistance transporter AzlC [Bacillus capparidis]MED1094935.1 AzlC family ABC transporter permease [Bacillus capparidis]
MKNPLTFIEGIRSGLTIAIGYIPVAFTFGLIAKSTELSLYETFLMSAIVFAGASQYTSLSLLAAQTSAVEIIFTTFVINIRHFLLSTTLNEIVERDRWLKKAVYAYWITDESFSVAAVRNERLTTSYMMGLGLIGYVCWVAFSVVGHLSGSQLPVIIQDSMGVALFALFIALLIPSVKKHQKALWLSVCAGLFHLFFYAYHLLSTGWAIVCATLLSAVLIEWADNALVRRKKHA